MTTGVRGRSGDRFRHEPNAAPRPPQRIAVKTFYLPGAHLGAIDRFNEAVYQRTHCRVCVHVLFGFELLGIMITAVLAVDAVYWCARQLLRAL